MKKLMSIMIGMSLVLGAATFAFADDTKAPTKKSDKKKKKKSTDDTKKS